MKLRIFKLAGKLMAAWIMAAYPAWADTDETVREVSEIVEAQYAYEDEAQAGRDAVIARLESGVYEGLEGEALAEQLTEDLRAFTRDNHIRVVFDPERVQHYRDREAARAAPDAQARVDAQHAEDVRESELDNFGIREVGTLPGRVGYIRIDYFDPNLEDGGAARIGAAMDMVEGSRAIVIDLRRCVGGHLDAVGEWLSYFLGREPVHYANNIQRWQGTETPVFTRAALPGARQPDVPVYIITSGVTFSGGEHFAYHMRHMGRVAAIIGERTYGGGVGWDPVVVNDEFYIRIPRELMVSAATGVLFGEGEGVTPDIAVPMQNAMARAHFEALSHVLAASDGDEAAEVSWALNIARTHAMGPQATTGLSAFTSQAGPYVFTADGDGLMLSFNGRPPYALERLSDTSFYDDRAIQRQFEFVMENGAPVALRVITDDGDVDELSFD